MKQMYEVIDGENLFFQECDIDDLVNEIELIPEVLKAGLNKEQIKEIALEFFQTMCKELILENGCFILPEKNFGYIAINDICNINHKDYSYDIDRGDEIHQPTIYIDYRQKIKAIYIVRFTGEMEKIFQDEKDKNHHY